MLELDPEAHERLRNALAAQCEHEELDRRTIVRIWRDWNAVYSLAPKPHRSILNDSIVSRLRLVSGNLTGRDALAAYEQLSGDVFVLCVYALVGWRCRCVRVPRLHHIDAGLIVTSADFAWTFGTDEEWKSRSVPVFVTAPMAVPSGRWEDLSKIEAIVIQRHLGHLAPQIQQELRKIGDEFRSTEREG